MSAEPTSTTPVRRPDRAAPARLRDAWPALAGLSAVFLFEMLDNAVLTVALPTIGRELHTSTVGLQWVTGAYSVVFGATMLLFGAVADRFGRRRVMLAGLTLLAAASLATAAVQSPAELIAVRAATGLAAAMTTPGSMALAFRLFAREDLRIRALTVISTAGLVGFAVGPTAGGFALAVVPWQALLLVNVPVALLALVGVRVGIAADRPDDLLPHPIDVAGAVLGTATLVGALLTPTAFVDGGTTPGLVALAGTALAVAAFVRRERTTARPLLDLALLTRPLVASGLAYKAAAGLAVSGLLYLTTLQLQSARGWTPAAAAIGMLPMVAVLLVGGRFVGPFVQRVGTGTAAWTSAVAVVLGLAVGALGGRAGYGWTVAALVLVGAGMRVVGAVAGTEVLQGLPSDRTSVGAALVDTASEVATGVGTAVVGTVLAAVVPGSIVPGTWTPRRLAALQDGLTLAGLLLTAVAAVLVGCGLARAHRGRVAA
ncbi:MFS transporter [Curtobacterium sp. DN_7.5]|uniref:MFS transporter n=1 Tax=Curtobacterium sp. DN_7.5 TaxID=3049047 RepID=UPI0024125D26|nr:MFS transporter [Curtobacterium sp. DN_7.5]